MGVGPLLDYLAERGVRVWVEDSRVRYAGRRSEVTDEVLSALKHFKPEILRTLGDGADDGRRDDEAGRLGLVARHAKEFGYISIHDPTTAASGMISLIRTPSPG